jgi:hypothetical protein
VHLDDADLDDDLDADDLAYLELPTDEEVVESAAEQKALIASFEMQRHDEAARRLMVAERRAAADDLATTHQSARQSAYLRTLAAVDKLRAVVAGQRSLEDRARVEAEWRLQYERARTAELARVREHQYPCPPTSPTLASQKMPNAAGSSCGKHASAVAWRQATMVALAVSTRAAPARAAQAPSSSR